MFSYYGIYIGLTYVPCCSVCGLASVICNSACVSLYLHPLPQVVPSYHSTLSLLPDFPNLHLLPHEVTSSHGVLSALLDFTNHNLDISVTTVGDVGHSPIKLGDAFIVMCHRSLGWIFHRSTSFFSIYAMIVPRHAKPQVTPLWSMTPCFKMASNQFKWLVLILTNYISI